MTIIIVLVTTIVSLMGVAFVAWSLINTRRRYYNEYVSRKRND